MLLGALGMAISLGLLILVWQASFWIHQTTHELTDGVVHRLEQTQQNLIDSERRVQRIRVLLDEIHASISQEISDKRELDPRKREKLLTLSQKADTLQTEARTALEKSQSLLLLCRESVQSLQPYLDQNQLDGLLERIQRLAACRTEV